MTNTGNSSIGQDVAGEPVTRRKFIGVVALSSAAFSPLGVALAGGEEMMAEDIRQKRSEGQCRPVRRQ